MTAIRELVTKIGFDVDEKKLKDLNKSLESVKKSVMAVAAAGAAAAAGLFALARSTAATGDRIAKASRDLGIGTTALQEYEFAAEQAGISNQELASGLALFSRNIGQAAKGSSTTATAFDRLGVSIRDSNGNLKSNEVLLEEVSNAMTGVTDASERAAISQELFGRSGVRLGVFLSQGSAEIDKFRRRAQELGIVLDEQTLNASEEFNDTLNELRLTFVGLKNIIGADLLPVITDITKSIIDFVLINRELIKTRLQEFIKGLVSFVNGLYVSITLVANTFSFFAQVVGGSVNAIKLIIGSIIAFKALAFAKHILIIVQGLFAMRNAIAATSLVLMKSPIGILAIVAAVLLAIKAFADWMGWTEKIIDTIKAIPEFFKQLIDSAKESVSEFMSYIADIFSSIWEYLSSGFSNALKSIGSMFMTTLTAPIKFVTGLIENLLERIGVAGQVVRSVAGFAGSALRSAGSFFGIGGGSEENINSNPDIAAQSIRPSNVSNINGGARNISVNSEVNVTVPPGTEAEQQRFLRQAARESFRAEYERELERVLFENPELE